MKQHDVIIVGAGLSGLSVAHFLRKTAPQLDILLLEGAGRPGGAIRSTSADGFLAEWGPHGFLDNVEEGRELLNDLDLGDQILRAPLRKFLRYICRNDRLETIPQTPPALIRSKLLPPWSKLRMFGDLFRKPRSEEQTIAAWASHRFGRAILPFADIALTGTYAGDIHQLSIDAAMPGLRKLELEYGSVFKGAIQSRRNKVQTDLPAMISFKQGMETMVSALAADKRIEFNAPVNGIMHENGSWKLDAAGNSHSARRVVIALHINRALPILNELAVAPATAVTEAVVYNVVMGFESGADIPFGFGYLAPREENRFALGALFPSHMFPGRAPEGLQSLEVLIGGVRNPHHLTLSDDALLDETYHDVSRLIQLPKRPRFQMVLRPAIGIPQLEMGHHRFQDYRLRMERTHPGLYVCGFGWDGIGVNDMIKQAKHTAGSLIEGVSAGPGRVTVKGVYF